MHTNSRMLFEFAREYFDPSKNVLEVGPDFDHRLVGASARWDTVGIDGDSRLTYRSKEYSFPIEEGVYDIVLSTNVIEHVRRPWVWIKELVRVCKPGGVVVTICPANWPYHCAPVDCWRIYPEGMKALYEDAGLQVLLNTMRVSLPHDAEETSWLHGQPVYDTIGIGRK